MKITIEVFGCVECPYLKTGKTYGNDGRDGETVYLCKLGAFGHKLKGVYEGYSEGKRIAPSYIPENCPCRKEC